MKVKVKSLSGVRLFETLWTAAHQAPLPMGFSRQEYWSGVPFSSPGDLPNPGIEPRSPALQADALLSEPPGKPFICSMGLDKCIMTYTLYPSSLYQSIFTALKSPLCSACSSLLSSRHTWQPLTFLLPP